MAGSHGHRREQGNIGLAVSGHHSGREVSMSCVAGIPVFRDSDQVQHKPGCSSTEAE